MFGRSVASVLITDVVNLVYAPNSTSYATLFIDMFSFVMMPIIGGVMMTSIDLQYNKDPKTYSYAKIDKLGLYSS